MKVLFGNHDILRAGEDHPAWLYPADDKPIEDEQVNEVEDEKHAKGIREQFPEGVTSQSCGSPKQCRSKGNADEQTEEDRHPLLLLRFWRDDLSDLLRIMPQEYPGLNRIKTSKYADATSENT